MSRRRLPDGLLTLARHQHGLVSRRQLDLYGVTADVVRRRLVDDWRLVLPGVVLLSQLEVDPAQRLVAAQLMAGADAFVTGPAAVTWHGLAVDARVPGRIDVLVPSSRAARTADFARLLRTHRLPYRLHQDGIVQVAPPERAVADAIRLGGMAPREANALAIRAVQKRAVKPSDLAHELFAGPRRRSALLRVAVAAAASGAWSAPEHDLLTLLGTSRTLPHAWPNPELRTVAGVLLPTPDAWFDDVGLAIQVHSYTHHSSGPDWDRTIRADSALAEAGVLRISVTPREISREPAAVLARIELLHRSRRTQDRPAVSMVARGPGLH